MSKRKREVYIPACPKCKSKYVEQLDVVTVGAEVISVDSEGNVDWGDCDVDWSTQAPSSNIPDWLCTSCGYLAKWKKFLPKEAVKELAG